MGCDIHAIVEQQADDGRWVTANTLSHFVARRRKDGERDWAFPAALERNYAQRRIMLSPGWDARSFGCGGLPDCA